MRLRLPKKENIWVTGRTDPIHRHYHPVIKYFMNKRLEGVLKLLGGGRRRRILDVGCGGGVFLPELSTRCDELYGVDIHGEMDKVEEMLRKERVKAALSYGDVTRLPFPEGYFDCVVALSVLEFVKDLDRAFGEISRVLKEDGTAVIGFPVENIFTDLAFFAIGINARNVHPVNQEDILTSAKKYFVLDTLRTFPLNLPLKVSLFAHCRLRKKNG